MATTLPSPSAGVISDGQHSLRKAVARALPGVPHQLCQFHYLYLRAAARPIFEADGHATKERKKRVRGVRPMERELEGRADGRCGGGRARLLPGGDPQCAHRRRPPARRWPPLAASGLKLKSRLEAVATSLAHVERMAATKEQRPRSRSGGHAGQSRAGG